MGGCGGRGRWVDRGGQVDGDKRQVDRDRGQVGGLWGQVDGERVR